MFTLAQLAAETAAIPTGSIVDDSTLGAVIVLSELIGESVNDLTSTKITEALAVLLKGCRAAQLTYNAGGGTPLTAANQVTSFALPTNSAVQTTTAGNEIIVRTYSMTARIGLDDSEILPNLGTL